MPRTIERLPTPAEASSRIIALAEPVEAIEVPLVEALGLVLAESVAADVDAPAFDRASVAGYAVRSAEALPGALLRVAPVVRHCRPLEDSIEAGEAIRVRRGDALPRGADAVLRTSDVGVDDDPSIGLHRVVEVLKGVEVGPGRLVEKRGSLIEAGAEIVPNGTRIAPAMVGLLASQGCVHPYCHRRVQVAVVAVGDHLVGPGEAPVMHRERNSTNASIVALAARLGAMTHDLQSVRDVDFDAALGRATSTPVIVVLGPSTRPIRRALRGAGVEPVVPGVAMRPGSGSTHGVIRDESGRVAHHVFRLPIAPAAASVAFSLLVAPLIGRLQGDPSDRLGTIRARWEGPDAPTGDRLRVVPVALGADAEGRPTASPIAMRSGDDLAAFARADGLALPAGRRGSRSAGDGVEVVRFDGV